MNKNTNYIRKVIYIALIGLLLVPISFLSRPTTRGRDNSIKDEGGVISRLRNEHELSQAKLSEIDAASEALRFSLLGMRGIASTSLWLQAQEAKEKEDWNSFEATLNTLVKIQPNFVKVWEYQAHNLSYNVSVEFDDYEFRYAWVKKGIEFLTEGIPYNRRDHRITDNLGFFTGQKIGRSDERVQYRQLFRKDVDFHTSMSRFPFIHPETRSKEKIGFETRDYGPDHWLMARQWYERSQEMVDVGVDGDTVPKRSSDYLFYMWSPAQLRNHIMSLQKEERPTDSFRFKWGEALDHWMMFGRRTLRTAIGVTLQLEGMERSSVEIERLRSELDKLAPGVREELENEIMDEAKLTDEEKVMLRKDPSELDDTNRQIARNARVKIFKVDRNIDQKVAERASDTLAARAIVRKIIELGFEQTSIGKYSDTTNYHYWKIRGLGEKTDHALKARMAIYQAQEKKRQSKFDRYVQLDPNTLRPQVDPETGKVVVADGAIQEYEKGFATWSIILQEHPGLQKGDLAEDLIEEMIQYAEVLRIANMEWPLDFPLQYLIDKRAKSGLRDGLPTTEDLADRREQLEDLEREKREREELEQARQKNNDKSGDGKKDDQPPAGKTSDKKSKDDVKKSKDDDK